MTKLGDAGFLDWLKWGGPDMVAHRYNVETLYYKQRTGILTKTTMTGNGIATVCRQCIGLASAL